MMMRTRWIAVVVAGSLGACTIAHSPEAAGDPASGSKVPTLGGDGVRAQSPASVPKPAPPHAAQTAPATARAAPQAPFFTVWCVTGKDEPSVSIAGLGLDDSAVILYEHECGLYPRVWKGKAENGGVPQQADIAAHLTELHKDVQAAIPDPNFSGWAIIDYEGWGPIYDNNQEPIKELSRSLTRQRHPTRTAAEIERLARASFQSAARTFMERTLETCKELRPNAKWGYYGMPWSHQGPEAGLDWVWRLSDALYPTVYVMRPIVEKLTKPNQVSMDYHRYATWLVIDLAKRLAPGKPVVAMVSARYSDDRERPEDPSFLSEEDLRLSLELPRAYGADGVVFWDAINSPEVAAGYRAFVTGTLGPGLIRFRRDTLSKPVAPVVQPPVVRDSQGEAAPGSPR